MDIPTLAKACETDDDSKTELNGNIFTTYNLQDNMFDQLKWAIMG